MHLIFFGHNCFSLLFSVVKFVFVINVFSSVFIRTNRFH